MARFLVVYFLTAAFLYTALGSTQEINIGYCTSLSITNGHRVSIEDAPWMVSIADDNEDNIICGGSIIHERFILTASTCIREDTIRENLTVLFGTDTLSEDGVFFGVEEVLCHQDYNDDTLDNDICLLKLSGAIPFAWLVQVELPDKDLYLGASTWVNVTGWGAKTSDGPIQDILRQVQIPILTDQCCENYYELFNADLICAGSRGADFCEGDVGGPLTYNGIQVGVISGVGECGKHPGAYTRVTSYVDWIKETIADNL